VSWLLTGTGTAVALGVLAMTVRLIRSGTNAANAADKT